VLDVVVVLDAFFPASPTFQRSTVVDLPRTVKVIV
jgi:hypothetical protein